MAIAAGPIINVWTDLEQNRGAGPIINVWTDLDQNRAAGPVVRLATDIGALQLPKGKQIARDVAAEGLDSAHFVPGGLGADAKGRAVVATGFFNAAAVADKFVDSSIDPGKIIGGVGGAPSFSGIKLVKGAVQTIPNITVTDLIFGPGDTTEWPDTQGNFSHNPAGAHPEEIVVNFTGKVQVTFFGLYLTFPAGGSFAEFYPVLLDSSRSFKDNTGGTISAPSLDHPQTTVNADFDVVAGDIIKVQTYQSTGGNRDIRGGAGKGWTSVSVRKL